MSDDRSLRVGVDIGGTFTDLVLVDDRDDSVHVGKTLTTPGNLMDGVLIGLAELLERTGHSLGDLLHLVHGTTVVTNAIIERKGVRVGLITTKGARDALEMGREFRYDIYDLALERPQPLVPRGLRREVRERMSVNGEVLVPLEVTSLDETVAHFRDEGVEAVAVALLHSYVNPAHEQQVVRYLSEHLPGVPVTSSAELVPVLREFERTSTTVANAYVQPLVRDYLVGLERRLLEGGLGGPLYIMLSSGGLTPVSDACAAPVKLIESGPAGGATAARFIGELVAERNLISFDMGGTTAKMCLIDGGVPVVAHEFETARVHRFKKGSGLPLKVPVIEMIEIGAGGGSIASLDAMGLPKVGPRSAGADPGPACYGLGGEHPTVTDADLLLGYVDPGFFLGGRMRLDRRAAADAFARGVAPGLRRDAIGAAVAVNEVVNEDMANATRLHVAERGRDLRSYGMVAFGGAGPVHAYRVAQLLGLRRLVLPYAAGTLSALGFLVAPVTYEVAATFFTDLAAIDWPQLKQRLAAMEAAARAALVELGIAPADVRIACSAEMRFVGQGYEIPVDVPLKLVEAEDSSGLVAAFHTAYRELFSRVPEGVAAEALTWRLTARGPRPSPALRFADDAGPPSTTPHGVRPVYFPDAGGFVETPVHRRAGLAPGSSFIGPLIIEEAESTAVIGPDAKVQVDGERHILVDLP